MRLTEIESVIGSLGEPGQNCVYPSIERVKGLTGHTVEENKEASS